MYSYIGLAALPTMAVMTVQAIFGQGTLEIQGVQKWCEQKLTSL